MAAKTETNPILVPVDFSEHAAAALIQASMLAECMKSPIVVLHVVHDPAEMPGYYNRMTKKKTLVRIEDLALEMFEAFMRDLIKNNPDNKPLKKAQRMLVLGLPVTRILEVAKKVNASMIVMGSQGRTGLKHLLLGSKAEQVVKLAPIPVTIVKGQ